MKAAGYSYSDPNSYGVRGAKAGDGSYWTGMKLVVSGLFCSKECVETDRIETLVTVNPGTETSKIVFTRETYLPNAGNFKNIQYGTIALCRGQVCGSQKTMVSSGSTRYMTLKTSSSRSGNVLTVAVNMRVSAPNRTVDDGAKTADCTGRTGSDKRCFY